MAPGDCRCEKRLKVGIATSIDASWDMPIKGEFGLCA